MKTNALKFILLSVFFTVLLGCQNEDKTKKIEQLNDSIKVLQKKITNNNKVDFDFDFVKPPKPTDIIFPILYQPEQFVKSWPVKSDFKYKRYRLKSPQNYFSVNDGKIHVEIPVSNKHLRINNVVNVSEYSDTNSTNAILITLFPIEGPIDKTIEEPTNLIISDLEISKIYGLNDQKLDPTRLIKDNKLRVFIFYNDIVTYANIGYFNTCAWKNGYSNTYCLSGPYVPAEEGGDVIGGKGGQ